MHPLRQRSCCTRRRRQQGPPTTESRCTFGKLLLFIFVCNIRSVHGYSFSALSPRPQLRHRQQHGAGRGSKSRLMMVIPSNLFPSRGARERQTWQLKRDIPSKFSSATAKKSRSRSGRLSDTSLMVLTTPESIIEQASTQNLLDDLIDESVRTSARRPIIMQFDPSSGWIWRRWKGTVFSETWTSCVRNMVYALAVYIVFRTYPNVKDYLSGFGTLWGQLLSVTTFTLTFFVNQSYALWRKCTQLSRRLQGRLHDIGLNCATHAARKSPDDPDEPSGYTDASRQVLELMSRYVRLFNVLTYASFTRSHRPILTPRGMRRLVERGLMTAQEREVLVDAAIPATQRHSAILMWMMRLFIEAREAGHIGGGSGFEQQTIEKFHVIRSQYGAIGDELQGRMPLAYAHIVQVLVDLILWMYPIMALSSGMSPFLAVIGTGLLTTSYQGLFDLAKQFLDPYDNENYGKGDDPLSVDTLIAETNAGSVRWLSAFQEMPFSAKRLKDGDLSVSLLPVKGYTVEEVTKMEEERIQKEKELEEQRLKEEAEQETASSDSNQILSPEEPEASDIEEEDDSLATGEVYSLYGGKEIPQPIDDETNLAESEENSNTVEDPLPPLTVEEYERQLAEAEKELRETQAILEAAPGADSINWKEEEEERLAHGQEDDIDNLDALEMDVDEEDALYIDLRVSDRSSTRKREAANSAENDPNTKSADTQSYGNAIEVSLESSKRISQEGQPESPIPSWNQIAEEVSSTLNEYSNVSSEAEKKLNNSEAIPSTVSDADLIRLFGDEKDPQSLVNKIPSDSTGDSTNDTINYLDALKMTSVSSVPEQEKLSSNRESPSLSAEPNLVDNNVSVSIDTNSVTNTCPEEDSKHHNSEKVTEENGSDDTKGVRQLTEEEQEYLETQAILSAAPGVDCIDWKEEGEQLWALENNTYSEPVEAENSEEGADTDLDSIEIDVGEDGLALSTLNNATNVTKADENIASNGNTTESFENSKNGYREEVDAEDDRNTPSDFRSREKQGATSSISDSISNNKN